MTVTTLGWLLPAPRLICAPAVLGRDAPALADGRAGVPIGAQRGHRQCGQATLEFVVLALAFVPLFLVAPVLGKYIDLMQAAEQASRYVAFEGTVRNSSSHWKRDTELAVEVRRRFFSNADAPVKTNDVAGDFPAHRNPIWSDAAGNPLLKSFDDAVSVQTHVAAKNALAGAGYSASLGLSSANLYSASVTLAPAKPALVVPLDGIHLRTTRKTVLLADSWTARSVGSIRNRIEGSASIYPIGAAAGLINLVGKVPRLVFDPALEVGEFDWDVVPCDRLVGGC